jgi:hypothetical protein
MLTKIVKWVSVAALLLALLWPSSAGYRILLAGFAVLCRSYFGHPGEPRSQALVQA